MDNLSLTGYNSSLTIMDIPTRFYDNVLSSFAHHDIVEGVGAYRPAIGLPPAFVGKMNNIEFVIPVGKICAALPINQSGKITIGGASTTEKYYATGEESLKSRGITSPGTITESNPNIGAGDTLLGEFYPLPGLYTESVDDTHPWPTYFPITEGFGISSSASDYNAQLNIPAGVLITHAKKWRRGTYLNNEITPTYSLIKQNRMVLPYLNVKNIFDPLGITWASEDAGTFTKFIHGYWRAIWDASNSSVKTEPLSASTEEQYKILVLFRAIRDVSRWYTFYWDTNNILAVDSSYPDYNEFMLNVKPDIFGNYTASDVWAYTSDASGVYEVGLKGVTTTGPATTQVDPAFYDNLVVGKVNSRDFNMPRNLLEYVDAPPGSGLGTDAGGIHPLVHDFAHDFILLMAYYWNEEQTAGNITSDFPLDIKAQDIYNYVRVNKVFGSADIFVEV